MAKNERKPPAKSTEAEIAFVDENLLKSRIYAIRGVKVMLDADLAEIYGYSTKAFNQQVKNNLEKFAEDFRFQLNAEELAELSRSKILTSMQTKGVKGGRVYKPFVFTEQGIYMLMTVLKGDLAVRQSMALIRLFKRMKDHIVSENRQLQIASVSAKVQALSGELHDVQDRLGRMDLDLRKVMENFIDPATHRHFLILNGQKLEADMAYAQIYGMAKKSLMIVDNYLDVKTLNLLRNVPKGVSVWIFGDGYGRTRLTEDMLADYRVARPDVSIDAKSAMHKFHDRYIFVDFGTAREKLYHCGASSKDASGRITTIVQLDDMEGYRPVFKDLLAQR